MKRNRISSAEAHDLLRKWKAEESPMRFLFAISSGGGSFSGMVNDLTASTVRLIGEDPSTEFILSLVGAAFEYGDAREGPDALKGVSAGQNVTCLTVVFPTKGRVYFLSFPQCKINTPLK
jgi:hypothetical protein